MASYPSDAAGVPAADGAQDATSWTAYGSAGITAATDEVDVFALCSTAAAFPPVQVARADVAGPDAQPGTTASDAPVSCPAGTRLLGGGWRLDESVNGTDGLPPQQGFHMRASYPTADGTTEPADGVTNPATWTALVQAGGANLNPGRHVSCTASRCAPRRPRRSPAWSRG